MKSANCLRFGEWYAIQQRIDGKWFYQTTRPIVNKREAKTRLRQIKAEFSTATYRLVIVGVVHIVQGMSGGIR